MNKLTFSYFEAGKKIEMAGKMLAKARKIYKSEIARGLKPEQAKRNASGQARGKTLRQAQGHRKEELQVKARGTAKGQKMPKSRIDKIPSAWAAYVFQDVLGYSEDESYPLSPFSMSSYDHTKKGIKGYNWEDLFAIHQFMERQVEFAFPDWLNDSRKANIKDGYVDSQEDARYKHRQYEWKMFDEDGELRYYLTYQKGEFQSRKMWDEFDFFQMRLELRELRSWE